MKIFFCIHFFLQFNLLQIKMFLNFRKSEMINALKYSGCGVQRMFQVNFENSTRSLASFKGFFGKTAKPGSEQDYKSKENQELATVAETEPDFQTKKTEEVNRIINDFEAVKKTEYNLHVFIRLKVNLFK